ncbi:MAG TPA: putative porin [Chthoniobacteraceae bacterium]|jgi:hypothetical protein
MTHHPIFKAALAVTLFGTLSPAQAASDSALLDALVRKGVLTDKEAASIQADADKEKKESSASKIKLSNSVTELKLYGDIRLRYQYDNKDAQADPAGVGVDNALEQRSPSGTQRSRWRFRLRLNADFKLGPSVFGGVELQTGQASDSANQTFENGFDDYNIFISRAYLGWNVTDYLTVVGGKMPNPFYATELVWDPDIHPTGVSEVFAFHKLFAPEEMVSDGYSKDGKNVAKSVTAAELPWELSLVAGQFIFDDNLEGGGSDLSGATRDNDATTDAYLFQTQLLGSYKFGGTKLTFAPGWMTYVNGSATGLLNENSFTDSGSVSGATRNLNILLAPGDVSFKIGSLKSKFYWDFAYNIEGRKRVEDIYNLSFLANDAGQDSDDDVTDPDDLVKQHSNVDDYAYLIGLQVGENKKRGDWSALLNWRQTGLGAVDPNLNDSDFAAGELNTRGFKLGVAYNFTDFAVGAVTYMHAWNLRDTLVGGEASGGNAIADSNAVQVLQVDVNVKF